MEAGLILVFLNFYLSLSHRIWIKSTGIKVLIFLLFENMKKIPLISFLSCTSSIMAHKENTFNQYFC